MKILFILFTLAAVAAVFPVAADDQAAPSTCCPFVANHHAWGDQDGDGLCDFTGLPVGTCQERGEQGANGRGNGSGECPHPDCPDDCDQARERHRDATGPGPGGGSRGRRG